MIRDAAHRHPVVVLAAAGQRQVELARSQLGVFVEHFVKIAQAEKEDSVLVQSFDLLILPGHWG